MAVPFTCSDCGGDGTRCRCHENRPHRWTPHRPTVEEIIRQNERIVENGLRELRRLRGGGA